MAVFLPFCDLYLPSVSRILNSVFGHVGHYYLIVCYCMHFVQQSRSSLYSCLSHQIDNMQLQPVVSVVGDKAKILDFTRVD